MAKQHFSLIACMSLAACGGSEPPPVAATPPPEPKHSVVLTRPQADAWRLLEEVAARCWLDHELAGAAMVVDGKTGRVVIVGETETLVEARPIWINSDQTRVVLSGLATEDEAKAEALAARLRHAEAGGDTGC